MQAIFTYSGTDIRELRARDGETVTATPLDESKYDRAETGPMYRIVFEDGFAHDAFHDELRFSA